MTRRQTVPPFSPLITPTTGGSRPSTRAGAAEGLPYMAHCRVPLVEWKSPAPVDDAQKQFRLKWTESGGPPVHPPSHRSFGSRLIEHSFVSQLQRKANLVFEPSGVACTLDIPLAVVKPLQIQ